MAQLKTQPSNESVTAFLNTEKDENRRKDCFEIVKLMQEVTGEEPKMWGASIVGFGSYHYKYASGREGDWMLTGFSPRKQNLTIYIMSGFNRHSELLEKLGKHKSSKACLYFKRLDDLNREVLKELILLSVNHLKKHAGCKED